MPNDDRRSGAQVLNSDGAISRARVVRATRRAASTLKVWSQQSLDWLGNLDSNQDKQSQSLLCYRYTIPQWIVEQVQWVMDPLGNRTGGPDRPHRLAALLLAHGRAWQVRKTRRVSRAASNSQQPLTHLVRHAQPH
jgi:hypothetical protein